MVGMVTNRAHPTQSLDGQKSGPPQPWFSVRGRPRRWLFWVEALIAFGLLLITGSQSISQTVFSDFPGASVGAWSVTDNSISATGLSTWTRSPGRYRWIYFGTQGVESQTPEFRFPSREFLGDLFDHRFVWSYDQENWQFFDQRGFSRGELVFQNDTPFTEDQVYVAYSTPYSFSRTQQLVADLAEQWFVHPTASADQDLIVGEIANLPLFGFRVTNPLSPEPKKKILLASGNHSGEMSGNFVLEGLLDFLVGDDPRAQQMRNVAEFFVYPLLDPLGRTEGFYRGNSQNPISDHNRFWDALTTGNTGGFAEIEILAEAMRNDTAADVDLAFDFHGFFQRGPNFIYTDATGAQSLFLRELQRLQPAIELREENGSSPPGLLEHWAKTTQGLNADLSFTPEFSANHSVEEWKQLGQDYALALYAELGSPDDAPSPQEIDHLTQAIRSGVMDLVYDLNRNGQVDWGDRQFLLSSVLAVTQGDTNLDGTTDFADFLALSAHFGLMANWTGGDFDGDGLTTATDFQTLATGYGRAFTTIPEPTVTALVLGCGIVGMVFRRGRLQPSTYGSNCDLRRCAWARS